jgi:hypothetical protein
MNYSQLDLDIENYDEEDLENFLNLQEDYTETDISNKENTMRTKILNGMTDKQMQNKLLIFMDEAKRMLIKKLKKNPLLNVGGSGFVIDKPQESITNFIQPVNSFYTDTAPGVLNKLRRRVRNVSLALNTLYRDEKSLLPTDCIFYLSYTLKNVVSIKLSSIELPESIYLVSSWIKTNIFHIKEFSTGLSGNIIIPDGCYNAATICDAVTNAINTTLGSGDRFRVFIDDINGKTAIVNTENEFEMYFLTPDTNNSLPRNFGWILGYRKAYYCGCQHYESEGLFNPTPLEYLYLVLNDYNISNSSNLVAVFNNTYIEKNILAKIPYSNSNFKILFDGNMDFLSPKRQYFGPVDINKIELKLLNKFGDPVILNCMDFSFTLDVEIAYDI